VTFDIDANGIDNVVGQDLGTGKDTEDHHPGVDQHVEAGYDQGRQEAEMFAAEDKKRRGGSGRAQPRRQYGISGRKWRSAKLGDKVGEEERKPVREQVDKLKET
jgi:molecular chaperone DnaK